MKTSNFTPVTGKLLLTITAVFLFQFAIAQNNCQKLDHYSPENDCAPCTMSGRNQKLQDLLNKEEEIDEMIERLETLVDQAQTSYENYGDLTWGRDRLDLDLAKAYHDAIDDFAHFDIDAAMNDKGDFFTGGAGGWSGYGSWNHALDGASTSAHNAWQDYEHTQVSGAFFDPASEGVANGEINHVWGSSYEIMHYLSELYSHGYTSFKLDCCSPDHPHEFYYTAADEVEEQLKKTEAYFDNFEKTFGVHLEAIEYFATGYNQYDADSKKDLDSLRKLSFAGVVGNFFIEEGIISKDQLETLNNILDTYDNVISAQNAIRNTMGDDAADAMGALFGDFTIEDLRENLGDLIAANPGKFTALSKLNKYLPRNSAVLGKIMGAIAYGEMVYRIGIEMFIQLDASGRITYAKDQWWTKADAYHKRVLQSLIDNAVALYTMKHMITALKMFVSEDQLTLPVNMLCGRSSDPQPPREPEITPGPVSEKDKGYSRWEFGANGGYVWINPGSISDPYASIPVDEWIPKLNGILDGDSFAPAGGFQDVTINPGWEVGLDWGYRVNDRLNIKLDLNYARFTHEGYLPIGIYHFITTTGGDTGSPSTGGTGGPSTGGTSGDPTVPGNPSGGTVETQIKIEEMRLKVGGPIQVVTPGIGVEYKLKDKGIIQPKICGMAYYQLQTGSVRATGYDLPGYNFVRHGVGAGVGLGVDLILSPLFSLDVVAENRSVVLFGGESTIYSNNVGIRAGFHIKF